MNKYRQKWREAGRCIYCGRPADGKRRCAICSNTASARRYGASGVSEVRDLRKADMKTMMAWACKNAQPLPEDLSLLPANDIFNGYISVSRHATFNFRTIGQRALGEQATHVRVLIDPEQQIAVLTAGSAVDIPISRDARAHSFSGALITRMMGYTLPLHAPMQIRARFEPGSITLFCNDYVFAEQPADE